MEYHVITAGHSHIQGMAFFDLHELKYKIYDKQRIAKEDRDLYDPSQEHDSCGIGFVAQIKGIKSHDIIHRGLEVLENMSHRGAESADNVTGDGAGILIQIPHRFILSKGIKVPAEGKYASRTWFFFPQGAKERAQCEKILIDSLVGGRS